MREVSTLDLEQNYFAIDDPYGDGDFRLLHLQNQIKDITPAGVRYDTYEEAAVALYEAEREMANMPFNKENNIGYYMVNGGTQLKCIMEARQLQKHMDIENDKVRVHWDMTLEEVKDFVKQRFEHQLKQSGLDDISLYMSRFDTLYEQGKMKKLMPTANQSTSKKMYQLRSGIIRILR